MSAMTMLETFCKYLFIFCACTSAWIHFHKDEWPAPDYYDSNLLQAPQQTATDREDFLIEASGHSYTIKPKFDYDLYGMVVSYSNADGFTNIWHHKRWQDFINVRDICVIWGANVQSGV